LKVWFFAFFVNFQASTLPLKFSNEIGVSKKEKNSILGLEKDWTTSKVFWFPHPNCNGEFLQQCSSLKKGSKCQKTGLSNTNESSVLNLFVVSDKSDHQVM